MFDGRDMTYAPPNEVAGRGVVQMPGGQGTFPSLTVAEHLRLASWLHRKDKQRVAAATEHVLELFPVLRARLDEPAGNLSGGQQQMLALGMAFIEQPAPADDRRAVARARAHDRRAAAPARARHRRAGHDGHPRRAVGEPRARRSRETAYFMEKGEIRFHGPTAELLERPDVLRSVFLEGADTLGNATRDGALGADGAPRRRRARRRRRSANGHDRQRRRRRTTDGRSRTATPPAARSGSGSSGVSKRFGGLAALTDVSFTAAAGEIVGFIGPNGAGKTTLFDTISGFIARRRRHDHRSAKATTRVDITRMPPALPLAARARPFVPGRPPVPVADRRRDHRARRSNATSRCATRSAPRCTSRSSPTPRPTSTARVEELLELLGITDFRDKLGRELSTGSRRIVDLACVLAHGPSVLLLDEPSSGIAQREAEALGPLLLRIREQTGATLLVIEHDVPLLLSISDRLIALDLGEIVCERQSRTTSYTIRRS